MEAQKLCVFCEKVVVDQVTLSSMLLSYVTGVPLCTCNSCEGKITHPGGYFNRPTEPIPFAVLTMKQGRSKLMKNF